MMKSTITLGLILVGCTIFAQKKYDISIQDQGHVRDAIISIPTKPIPAGGYPVVFMLHGTSGDSEVFYTSKGWKELGQEENFITVFPSSLKWCFFEDGIKKNNTKFVCGDLVDKICEEQKNDLIDDIAFFKKLIKLLGDTVKINPNKIYASGFSNGDLMVNKIAMDAPTVFSAVGGSSGTLHELDSLTPTKRIPIWYMVGTSDDRFLVPPYTSIPFGGDSSLAYLQKIIKRFLTCQGLADKYRLIESPINKTYVFDECSIGETCAPFFFTINKGQTHQFPNGLNYPFDAPKYLWSFFSGTLSTAINETQLEKRDNIKCFPNPVYTQVTIQPHLKADQKWSLELTDMFGKKITKVEDIETDTYVLQRNTIPSGAYIVSIKSLQGTMSSKLFFQ